MCREEDYSGSCEPEYREGRNERIRNLFECSSWGDWSSWSVCSATCGVGVRSQVRKCVNGTVGDKGCQGSPAQLETCESENGPCKSWSTWQQWSDCTATCSGGLKIRSRTCFNGSSGDVGCTGNETDSLACNEQPCTYWAQWSENKLCSVTCGGGFVVRERSCVNGDTGELGCEGSAQEPSECNTQECPGWSYWSTWTECSLSCGSGKRTHSRQCIDGEVGNVGCEGNDFEEQDCNTKNCSTWGDWSSWTSCSVSCDDGILSRSRQCINGSIGDGGCLGNSVENSTCNTKPCPQFSSWGLYSPCSATCNGGIQSRNRTCLHDNSDGTGCQGSTSEIIPCGTKPCLECLPNQQEIGFQFGSVACSNETKVGSICIFTCQPGYLIVGSSELECLEKNSTTALWDGEPPDCQAKCTDLVDVVFVIDSSSSIRSNNFKIIQRFLVSLVQQFRVGMNATKFGAIRYNRHVDHLWNLKDNPTTEDVINAIENIPYDGSGTLTGKALNYTRENLFLPETGRRRGVAKVVVVITDGKSFDDIVTPSQLLKQDNTFIVVLGIGRVDSNQISQIASEPKLDFATIVEDFSSLNQNLNKVASQIRLCQGNQNITLCPSSTVMDVLFIVDGSSSIGTKNFEIVKNFVISLIEVFKVGNDTTQIGYIRYNAVVDERFQFGEYNNTEDVLEAVRRVPYRGQGTRTGQAITYAANNALSATAGRRPGVPAIAIVITDGRSQDSVFSGAQLLRNKAKVIAVGVKGAAIQDLDMIATDPDIQNVFIVNDFDSLLGQVDSISSTACYLSRNA
ncbi:unnamed protein product [Clavelina lepadiformis]|uniref:Uncharacterized protein n=1 Tax=Clavelina lepadiformis TaxID=159417 RepID=A0ABP0F8K1_CLALP